MDPRWPVAWDLSRRKLALAAARSIALDTVWRGERLEVRADPGRGVHVRARLPWWSWGGLGMVQVWQSWKLRRSLRAVKTLVGVPLTVRTARVW